MDEASSNRNERTAANLAPTDEGALIEAALSGDASAFEGLVIRHQDRLHHAMIHVTGSVHDAEEVTQEAFIRAFVKLDTFQQNSQFFTWLYRVAFNIALSRKRRQKVRLSLDQQREEIGEEVVCGGEAVDANMIRQDDVSLVQLALRQLSDEHRSILVLREMNESSYEEMAEILELSIGTVRSRLNRARKQLRLAIEQLREPESESSGEPSS
ncbi:RNA polymerase sigma factor [Rhodopirellula baltica]|uniref:RNA polymerase sigma factor n=4 Tax=Rhodopirellula baltica TaxID=265606 RepID=Q7UFL5_RHOBA|nr:sigma-70 family RNA polymerase sigma factor [Rhodopirellula baltica]EGF24701.1 RNA polymerase sigma factor sigW [Rhodopirellula baltica WH47]EKK04669.1 RNA polymerase sigma factor sigW [Rhodopirellula baltica SH28]ELP32182.1 RNA polymerase sigma factor sigW [Rhodopirellula baltica SWK14]CAD78667.1 RNA polymerase sigma factor sigW [Rhodopirellula baltica SH 1]HBE65461.1 RNA polymerase subunit sigma-70 [Rhodopirellula baltica]